MKTAKVTVLPYDSRWAEEFEAIKTELRQALGELALAIEHVGSTSVEGMSAKPCIDIDVVIESDSVLDDAISRLERIGYIYEGDLGIPDRHAFRYDSKPHLQKHHLYLCPLASAELRRHIVFRDFLRANKQAAAEYSAVKEEGARLYPDDIDGYIAHKSPCIARLYKLCSLE